MRVGQCRIAYNRAYAMLAACGISGELSGDVRPDCRCYPAAGYCAGELGDCAVAEIQVVTRPGLMHTQEVIFGFNRNRVRQIRAGLEPSLGRDGVI